MFKYRSEQGDSVFTRITLGWFSVKSDNRNSLFPLALPSAVSKPSLIAACVSVTRGNLNAIPRL